MRTFGPEGAIVVPRAAPSLAAVELVAPPRAGRTVSNLEEALRESEIRLKLAWLHRDLLDRALPQDPPFHAHAWTALRLLQERAGREAGEAGSTQGAIDRLLAELVRIRKIVAATTGREDPAREQVGFGRTLRASWALVDQAEAILSGAEQVRGQFPALTPALLVKGWEAFSGARKAVERSKSREVETAVERTRRADDRQLALDVLLHCIDHLRAAAMGELSTLRPRLADRLEGPLESRSRADEDREPEPAPAPPDGPG